MLAKYNNWYKNIEKVQKINNKAKADFIYNIYFNLTKIHIIILHILFIVDQVYLIIFYKLINYKIVNHKLIKINYSIIKLFTYINKNKRVLIDTIISNLAQISNILTIFQFKNNKIL